MQPTRLRADTRPAPAAAAAAVLAFALVACAPSPRAPDRTSGVSGPAVADIGIAPAARPAAAVYDVVADRSELRVLVRRGGPLARLGHDHVLVSRDLRGEIRMADASAADVKFEVSFAVATLALDEPADRAAEGAEFDSRPTAADVAGTRRNLEGAQVLDAARFPRVAIRGLGTSGGPDRWLVRAAVDVRGLTHEVTVPALVERDGETLAARGEFVLRQSAIGLTPFSVAMGALQVRDELTIRYSLLARRR